MKQITLVLAIAVLQSVMGQSLFTENFDYVDGTRLVGNNGWTVMYTGTAMNVGEAGLTYTGYEGSGVGNALEIIGGVASEHPYRVVDLTASGDVYLSFLVNVTGTNAAEGFFASLANIDGGNFRAVVYTKIISGSVYFGVQPSLSGTVIFDATPYSTETTYLIILKYSYIDGTVNDQVRLYVLSGSIPETEPETPSVGPLIMPSEGYTIRTVILSSGAFSAGSALNGATILVDGIRVGTTWAQTPLPVELTSFTATASDRSVGLVWKTAAEVNNHGFEVERKDVSRVMSQVSGAQISPSSWTRVAFVEGNGNSNSLHEYSYTDRSVSAGTYSYRLKQIDRDGKFSYSQEVEATISSLPAVFALEQNYPNPFNPATTITYQLPVNSHVTLKVYDAVGRETITLVNEMNAAGRHEIPFDASHLASGVYFYRLTAGSYTAAKRFVLMK
ncbi:MAG: T9SS type A sorting domain-containing protein [Bacteroidetes bacterium]|nr:T9SS type A sorting domain-containing protein [Bacteroidota bacterium]